MFGLQDSVIILVFELFGEWVSGVVYLWAVFDLLRARHLYCFSVLWKFNVESCDCGF